MRKKLILIFHSLIQMLKIVVFSIIVCVLYASLKYRRMHVLENFTANASKTYNGMYSEVYDTIWNDEGRYEAEAAYISKNIRGIPEKILDLGCGTGNHIKHWAKMWPGAKISGMDLSIDQIFRARLKHPEVNIMQGDLLNRENWGNNTFDMIACMYGAGQYTHETTKLFDNVFYWLKPGGTFVFHGIDPRRLCDGCDQLASNTDLKFRTNDKGHCVVLYPGFVYTSWWTKGFLSNWVGYNEVLMEINDDKWPSDWDISKSVGTNVPIGMKSHTKFKRMKTNGHRLYLVNPKKIVQIGLNAGFKKVVKDPPEDFHLTRNQGSEEYMIMFEK